jgi:phage baseplate assembly protein W
MIPSGGAGNVQLQQVQQPSKTYLLDPITNRIVGAVDGLESVKQAVYKILQTERFEHSIYGADYGSELNSVIGKSASYVKAELARRVQEALLQDDRIKAVEDLKVTINGDSALAEFTVISTYGSFQTTKEV